MIRAERHAGVRGRKLPGGALNLDKHPLWACRRTLDVRASVRSGRSVRFHSAHTQGVDDEVSASRPRRADALLAAFGCAHNSGSTSSSTSSTNTTAKATTTTTAPAAGNVQVLSGGVRAEDLKVGDGALAETGTNVTVHYTGWLTDGTKFDSSVDRGDPFKFRLGAGQVIRGWDEGVKGMRVGGKRKLTIPPDMGYGARRSARRHPAERDAGLRRRAAGREALGSRFDGFERRRGALPARAGRASRRFVVFTGSPLCRAQNKYLTFEGARRRLLPSKPRRAPNTERSAAGGGSAALRFRAGGDDRGVRGGSTGTEFVIGTCVPAARVLRWPSVP